jgi:HTH-type transcriptional regulator/antitoxin HipB
MNTNKIGKVKTKTLSQIKDKYIGKRGSADREKYEYELHMEILGKMIRAARKERKLSQEELGNLIGVQKAQISKLESSANSATIDTILKVFGALKAEISFQVKLKNRFLQV